MKLPRRMLYLGSSVVLLSTRIAWAASYPPGLVVGLRHNVNQPACDLGWSFPTKEGGDLGAPAGKGFGWQMVPDNGTADPASWKLPPGVVFALKHSVNQHDETITAFGHDPTRDGDFPGFTKQCGGDLGAPSGQGYCWYESTGNGDVVDWSVVDALPKGTIVGLAHSVNQRGKAITWKTASDGGSQATRTYNPASSQEAPKGFKRMAGGDLGAKAGQGYYWFQKVTCPCSKAEGEGGRPSCN